MVTNTKPVHRRILLGLSGEALQDTESFGIDASILDCMTQEIKELVELGIQVDVVVGGGNLLCGTGLTKAGMSRVMGDHMGMLMIVMNGLAMRGALYRAYVNARLMPVIPLSGMCDSYSWAEAISLLRNDRMMILSVGTGNPFSTTSLTARLRDIEIEAGMVLKATKVDGVFTADPAKDPTAVMCEQLTYGEVLEKELKVMGLATFTLARGHKLPVRVSDMNRPGALRRVVMGEEEGTLITE